MDDALNNAACSDPACAFQFWTHKKFSSNWDECPKCGAKAYIKANEQRLREMRFLKKNWDSYNGCPPSEKTISRAERLLSEFGEFRPEKVTPTCTGGSRFGAICFTWQGSYDRRVCLELYDHGKDYIFLMDGCGDPSSECVTGRTPQNIMLIIQNYLHGE